MSSGFLSFTIAAGIAGMAAGCGARSPAGPSSVAVAEPPAPIAVAGVSPAVGSTSGSTPLKIAGSGFQTGATVTIDGITIPVAVADDRATIRFRTPPHAAGMVELVVTNPDGGEARLAGAYVYVPAASFDFDGEWAGAAADLDLRFTVQDGALVSVSCGASGPVAFSPAPAVNQGEFSIVAADGRGISARIVSATDAVGTINLAPCRSTNWTAKRVT
jgi:IPT/TIG domain